MKKRLFSMSDMYSYVLYCSTLIKKKINFPYIIGNSEGSGVKSYMTNASSYMMKIFVHFLIYY
jgi:hypothetical protein